MSPKALPPERYDLDLGDDHYLSFVSWKPDYLPANVALYGEPLPNVEKAGCSIWHLSEKDENWHSGFVTFDVPETKKMELGKKTNKWQVESWEPLTLSPSILCSCGDHGFVREGKWVKA